MYVEANRQAVGPLFAFVFMLADGETEVHSSADHPVEDVHVIVRTLLCSHFTIHPIHVFACSARQL
jgi:hypothetical protein